MTLTFIIYASDFTKTFEFYADILGLEVAESWDREESKGARFTVGDGGVIEVYGAGGDGLDPRTRVAGVSLGLDVANVDDWVERLRAQQVECTDPVEEWWGGRVTYVFDPNGLPVLISESGRHLSH